MQSIFPSQTCKTEKLKGCPALGSIMSAISQLLLVFQEKQMENRKNEKELKLLKSIQSLLAQQFNQNCLNEWLVFGFCITALSWNGSLHIVFLSFCFLHFQPCNVWIFKTSVLIEIILFISAERFGVLSEWITQGQHFTCAFLQWQQQDGMSCYNRPTEVCREWEGWNTGELLLLKKCQKQWSVCYLMRGRLNLQFLWLTKLHNRLQTKEVHSSRYQVFQMYPNCAFTVQRNASVGLRVSLLRYCLQYRYSLR